jgi:pimeloyl-ACP methyl ester carboxylesterase
MNLPEAGWHTLSLQLPVLKNEADSKDYPPLFDEVPERIQAGVDFLKAKGINNIVIIGHSLGNTMTTHYLATKKDPAVRAFVAISFGPGYPQDPRMHSYNNFSNVTIPTLDIYGSGDFEGNLKGVEERKKMAIKAGNKNFQQVRIEGANHFFSNMDDVLLQRVRGWLKRNATGTETKK